MSKAIGDLCRSSLRPSISGDLGGQPIELFAQDSHDFDDGSRVRFGEPMDSICDLQKDRQLGRGAERYPKVTL